MEAQNQKTKKFNLSGNVYYPPGYYKQTKDDPGAIRHNDYLKILDWSYFRHLEINNPLIE